MRYFNVAAVLLFGMASLSACTSPSQKVDNAAAGNAVADKGIQQLIDTTKLKTDMSDVLNSLASGKPDTTKMKTAAADIMNTTAAVLSDSGVDKLYGNSNDPSVKAAGAMVKKLRDATGLTPAALDSLKNAANLLRGN